MGSKPFPGPQQRPHRPSFRHPRRRLPAWFAPDYFQQKLFINGAETPG